MRDLVRDFVHKHGMIEPGMNIVAGISGGADSVCLLFLLREICAREGAGLTAVHVNHCLRGEESDGDEEFVRALCGEWGVPLKVYRADVSERAAAERISLEEAGRQCRYEAFRDTAKEMEPDGNGAGVRIAVAHHQGDQAETVLFNLFRGSGIRGLCGIKPVHDGIIRPLLCVPRAEILDFLEKEGISFRTDSTNLGSEYARNRIRNDIIPLIESEVNTAASVHVASAAEELCDIEAYLEKETDKGLCSCVEETDGSIFISKKGYESLDPLIRSRVLRRCMGRLGGLKDVGREHIRQLDALMGRQTGAALDLPYGRKAVKEYEGIRLLTDGEREKRVQDESPIFPAIPGETVIDGVKWSFTILEAAGEKIPQKRYTKFFDCDRIGQNLAVRHRMPGDFLEINREHGTKTLKKYFVDEKVPGSVRGTVHILADGSHILWVPGYRISEGYKVTDSTKRILKVEIGEGGEDG